MNLRLCYFPGQTNGFATHVELNPSACLTSKAPYNLHLHVPHFSPTSSSLSSLPAHLIHPAAYLTSPIRYSWRLKIKWVLIVPKPALPLSCPSQWMAPTLTQLLRSTVLESASAPLVISSPCSIYQETLLVLFLKYISNLNALDHLHICYWVPN